MTGTSKIAIGIVFLIIAYYVGVSGSFGEKSQYEWTDGPQGPGIYKITYSYNYPWLGILFAVCGIIIAVIGAAENYRRSTEIMLKKEEQNCPDDVFDEPDNS